MSKHAHFALWSTREQREPKHGYEWTDLRSVFDERDRSPYTPGKHAKPFAKHHPATPVTYDKAGTVTPLRTAEHQLDMAA